MPPSELPFPIVTMVGATGPNNEARMLLSDGGLSSQVRNEIVLVNDGEFFPPTKVYTDGPGSAIVVSDGDWHSISMTLALTGTGSQANPFFSGTLTYHTWSAELTVDGTVAQDATMNAIDSNGLWTTVWGISLDSTDAPLFVDNLDMETDASYFADFDDGTLGAFASTPGDWIPATRQARKCILAPGGSSLPLNKFQTFPGTPTSVSISFDINTSVFATHLAIPK